MNFKNIEWRKWAIIFGTALAWGVIQVATSNQVPRDPLMFIATALGLMVFPFAVGMTVAVFLRGLPAIFTGISLVTVINLLMLLGRT